MAFGGRGTPQDEAARLRKEKKKAIDQPCDRHVITISAVLT